MNGDLTEADTPQGVIHYAYDASTGNLVGISTDYTKLEYSYDQFGELPRQPARA